MNARTSPEVWLTPKLLPFSKAKQPQVWSKRVASKHPEACIVRHTLIISSSSALCAMCSVATVSAGRMGESGLRAPFSTAGPADASAAGTAGAATDIAAGSAACIRADVAPATKPRHGRRRRIDREVLTHGRCKTAISNCHLPSPATGRFGSETMVIYDFWPN